MPAWRIPPPNILRKRLARAMNSVEPTRHEPTGAPDQGSFRHQPFPPDLHGLHGRERKRLLRLLTLYRSRETNRTDGVPGVRVQCNDPRARGPAGRRHA